MIGLLLCCVLGASAMAPPDTGGSSGVGVGSAVDQPRPGIRFVHAAENGPPSALRVDGVLDDPDLAEALDSGLPLRFRFRIELWRDRWIDVLVATSSWTSVLLHDPLERVYVARDERAGRANLSARGDFAALRAATHRDHALELPVLRSGRYYYTAVLEIESLTLTDIEELERWLQGQLQPALTGERAVGSAIGQGAKRLLMRLLRLPTRRFEVRSARFTIDDD